MSIRIFIHTYLGSKTWKSASCLLILVLLLNASCVKQPDSTSMPEQGEVSSSEITTPARALTPNPIAVTSSPLPTYGFMVGDKPFQFLGAVVDNPFSDKETKDMRWSEAVDDDLIKSAKINGITVLEMTLPLFESQLGVYQEAQLAKLDHLLDSAFRNGVYVIIPFIHAWGIALHPNDPYYNPGGIEGLIKDEKLRKAFKKRMAALIIRVNTVNGKRYIDDPTILAWKLCEEMLSAPQNYPAGAPNVTIDELSDWVEEMSSYIKSLDTNHLVTIDPGAIAKIGDNWLQVLQVPSLDFIRVGDAEGRIIHLTQDDNMDVILKIFSINKPVVMSFSFDGGSVNQELYSKDYAWQAENLRKIFKAYYEKGVVAGFIIYKFASEMNKAYMLLGDYCYSYTSSNTIICQALVDVSATLGPLNATTIPLQFVKLSSR